MQRLPLHLQGLRGVRQTPSLLFTGCPFAAARPFSTPTHSSPEASEKASASSGGSRSKTAAEQAQKSSSHGGNGGGNGGGGGPVPVPDPLADGDMRGRTGGGKPLESSRSPPPPPKVDSASVPGGTRRREDMTPEQRAEVDRHNEDFARKHDRAESAPDDRVDKKFWKGGGERGHDGKL